jgi:[acyl-carrier-protein] S-malonyltransferase
MGLPWRGDPAWHMVERLSDATGRDLAGLLTEADAETLKATRNAQLAAFGLSLVILEAARAAGLAEMAGRAVAGHSLGEYTAAAAAGALSLADGIRLVSERGRLMAAIQSERPGTMGAIIGLPAEQVAVLCREASERGVVAPANLNTPSQTVVSGEEAGVARLLELAEEAGAERTIRLQVGAAFHSALMEPVQSSLRETMAALEWHAPQPPLVSNASAQIVASADQVREALIAQIASPVLWVDCVRTLIGLGVTSFLELGAGRVLIGLVRQIDGEVETFAADSPKKLAKFAELAAG